MTASSSEKLSENFAYLTLGHTAPWLQDEANILFPLTLSAASLMVCDEIVES